MDDKKQGSICGGEYTSDYINFKAIKGSAVEEPITTRESQPLLNIKYIALALTLNSLFVFVLNVNIVAIQPQKVALAEAKNTRYVHSYLYFTQKELTSESLHQPETLTVKEKVVSSKPVSQPPTDSKNNQKVVNKITLGTSSKVTPSIPSIESIKSATRSYLQRKQVAELSLAAGHYAETQTQLGTLSEMTPSMESAWVPKAEKFEDKRLIHSVVDPNRIVNEGHECWRVIKIGNRLKPDAEILGYKFKCGLTDTEKALKAAMSNRIPK
ncbi:hypothetical protein D5018_05035 [Parashewanella curva]|uniref:Uncharacterized protein n=1 Tax=Parashewanella curva TaxID=2338552 RepID=A0A3L8Q268_9GAMM|nr:hypothetical protein [Parashewanella curva]RLV60833.1 hypothetical protein D5018_05035 [Parashewanella curva]